MQGLGCRVWGEGFMGQVKESFNEVLPRLVPQLVLSAIQRPVGLRVRSGGASRGQGFGFRV